MKKMLTVAAALAIALAGCSSAPKESADTTPEPEAEVVEENTAEEEPQVQWTDATDAAAAAKGAGFDRFGVISSFKLGDLEFKDAKFSYSGGVAQAVYETPATMFTIRKADGNHSVPVSDRVLGDFQATWTKDIDGITVNCYGPAKGATTVATWKEGTREFGVTFQGLGGDEMTMDSDEVAAIVKGIMEADAEKKEEPKTEEKTETTTPKTTGSLPSESEAEALAEKTGGGTCTSLDKVTTKQYGECWYAVVVDASGNKLEYYITADGIYIIDEKGAERETSTPTNNGGDASNLSSQISESEAREIAAALMDGYATDSYYTVDKTYGEGWHVTVEDSNGNVTNYLVTGKGDAYAVDAKNI
jgi:hypothetical protein